MPALAKYMLTAFAFVFLVMFMIVLHSLRWLAFRFSCIRRKFVHWRSSLVGAVGTIFMAVFISVSSSILAPLRCELHPNGQRTVQSYKQVVRWNSDYGLEHRNMVVAAAFASLVPSVLSPCVFGWLFPCRVACAKVTRCFFTPSHFFSFDSALAHNGTSSLSCGAISPWPLCR